MIRIVFNAVSKVHVTVFFFFFERHFLRLASSLRESISLRESWLVEVCLRGRLCTIGM